MPVRKISTPIYIISFSACCLGLICLNISPSFSNSNLQSANKKAFDALFPGVSSICDAYSMQSLIEEVELLAAELNSVSLVNPDIVFIPIPDLTQEIKSVFGDEICVSYQDLPEGKRDIYDEISRLIDELKALRKKVDSVSPSLNGQRVIA